MLRDAVAAVATGHPRRCSRLAAFGREVEARMGRGIAVATATAWIADAARIRAVLSC